MGRYGTALVDGTVLMIQIAMPSCLFWFIPLLNLTKEGLEGM